MYKYVIILYLPVACCTYVRRYMRRRIEVNSVANKTNPHVLSMIIDIMDAQNCQIPWMGSQDTFGEPLKQTFVGVKEHGYGMHVFPAVDTLRKSANLTIYIIDTIIEGWKNRHGYYPKTIYIQLDGGSENANKYVLDYYYVRTASY